MRKKTIEKIPETKKQMVEELVSLVKNKKTILVASIKDIPGSQYQIISKKLRGKAVIKVPKKNLLFRALENRTEVQLSELEEKIIGSVAILFSDINPFELALELLKNKSPAKAKAGQIAPKDIEIPSGPTDLTPGPAISELGALGIQIQIHGGKIEIKESKIVAHKGKPISKEVAEMLGKLNIFPILIGFLPLAAYDAEEKKVYLEINIDIEGIRSELNENYLKALSFAVDINYYTNETVKIMVSKAGTYEDKLIRIINGNPEKEKIIKKEKEIPEESKEESKVDAGEGLASLFG